MASPRKKSNYFAEAKYEAVILMLKLIAKEEMKGDVEKKIEISTAAVIIARLLRAYCHPKPDEASKAVIRLDTYGSQNYFNSTHDLAAKMEDNHKLKHEIDLANESREKLLSMGEHNTT